MCVGRVTCPLCSRDLHDEHETACHTWTDVAATRVYACPDCTAQVTVEANRTGAHAALSH